jgi:hypothetical protein
VVPACCTATPPTGELYTLDLGTGAASLVADDAIISPEGAIAFNAGALYGTNGNDFGAIDLGTALFTSIGDMGSAADDISGMTFADGDLYGYSLNGTADDSLVSIDPLTGIATEIGLTGLNNAGAVGGLAWDSGLGELLLSDGESLFSVDALTGGASLIGAHGVSGMSGIAVIPAPGVLSLLGLGLVVRRRRRH